MARFRIPKIPSSTTKSIRFPNGLIDEVEAAIRGTDCTFSAFVVAAVRAALADLKEQSGSLPGEPGAPVKSADNCPCGVCSAGRPSPHE